LILPRSALPGQIRDKFRPAAMPRLPET